MNKQELIEDIKIYSSIEYAVQRRPYLFVELRYEHDGRYYNGVGFSKVCYPDEWDAAVGSDIAFGRAVGEIYQQIKGTRDDL